MKEIQNGNLLAAQDGFHSAAEADFLQETLGGSRVAVGLHLAGMCVRARLGKVLKSVFRYLQICCVVSHFAPVGHSFVLIVLETRTFLAVTV